MDYSFIVLVISIFASRFIQLNAFKNLKEEDRGKVLSKSIIALSQASLIFTIILIVAFYFLINKYPDRSITLTSSFFVVLILQRIIVYALTRIGVALFIVLFMWQFNNGIK